MNDLELDKDYTKGSRGQKVKLIQEWLCLQGLNVVIDEDFGPATERAVKMFQQKKRYAAPELLMRERSKRSRLR